MQPEIQNDIGEEVLLRLNILISKLNKILKLKDEKELSDSFVYRNRAS